MVSTRTYNLVISTGRWKESLCISELRSFARLLEGVDIEDVRLTGFPGLITATVTCDPKYFVEQLREYVITGRFVPSFILRVVPIEVVVKTNLLTELAEVQEKAVELALSEIAENQTYKIEVRYRGLSIDRRRLIDLIAKRIPRKVKLEDPDRVLYIDIFPDTTGISVLDPRTQIFSLLKALREARQQKLSEQSS